MLMNRLLTSTALQLRSWHRNIRLLSHSLTSFTTVLDDKNKEDVTFSDLFQRSKFATMLDPANQKVEGKVLAVVNNNMYVDFGFKFHAVVPVPKDGDGYAKGTRVVVRVVDLEMTNHFIGDHRDISLLEAEAEFIGKL